MGDGGFCSFVLRKGVALPPPKAVFLVYLTGRAFCCGSVNRLEFCLLNDIVSSTQGIKKTVVMFPLI